MQQCVVCLEEYRLIDSVSVSNCHHHFHTNCIDTWSAHRLHDMFPFVDCPMCRDECVINRVEQYSDITISDGRVFGDTRSNNSSATSLSSVTSAAQQFVIGPAAIGHDHPNPQSEPPSGKPRFLTVTKRSSLTQVRSDQSQELSLPVN